MLLTGDTVKVYIILFYLLTFYFGEKKEYAILLSLIICFSITFTRNLFLYSRYKLLAGYALLSKAHSSVVLM